MDVLSNYKNQQNYFKKYQVAWKHCLLRCDGSKETCNAKDAVSSLNVNRRMVILLSFILYKIKSVLENVQK